MRKIRNGFATSCRGATLFLGLLVGCSTPRPMPLGPGRAELATLRAEAKIEVRRGGRRAKFHASLLVAYPDRLLAEVSGFGFPSALLSFEGERTRLFVPSERRAYESMNAEALSVLFGVRIPAREWILLLLGKPLSFPEKLLLENPISTPEGIYPSHIRVTSGDSSIDIQFKEVQANPTLPADLFRIDFPPEIKPTPLEKRELWPQ